MENLEIRKDVKRTGTRKKCNLGRIGKTLEIHGNPWKSKKGHQKRMGIKKAPGMVQ